MRRHVIAVMAALLALGAMGVGVAAAEPPTEWYVDEEKLPFDPLRGAEARWGVHEGAGYRIEVPEDWNGDVLLYAHGYRGTGPELTVSNPSIRSHLIAEGYAWAASSYRANGYVPGLGAADTHQLLGVFENLVGDPDRVYLAGHSMGGHVTGFAIEQWPASFDGALPMCGLMGDNELFDFFQDIYLVAETLVGNEPAVPTPADYRTNGWLATEAQLGPGYPQQLNDNGERLKAVIENLTGGDRPIFDEGFAGSVGGEFLFGRGSAGTGPGRENVDTLYQFDDDPALSAEEQAFNDEIVRIEAEPQYRRPGGLGRLPGTDTWSPYISGDISIPVVSLHTLGEFFVPFHMQQVYAQRIADHGAADLLVTRAIRDTRHCGFSTSEQVQAFDDLVRWVEDGVRPAGDVVLDPDVVGDADYGCRFTVTDATAATARARLPACP